jgi:hypothetical protein
MRIASILAAAALALSACAQSSSPPLMAAGDCAHTDWREAGWSDGAAGRTQAAYDERAAICAAEGVAPDEAAYFEGRVAGLQAYCAPSNGYRLGLEGEEPTGICPPGLRETFLAEYQRGRTERAQAGTGSWSRSVGVGGRIGIGTSGVRSGVGVSIGL